MSALLSCLFNKIRLQKVGREKIALKPLAHVIVMFFTALALCQAQASAAENAASASTDHPQPAAPAYASVQENLKAMDHDGDGQVSVLELRAYLEARHGKGYEQKVMDDLEASAKGKSCATPFAQSFY